MTPCECHACIVANTGKVVFIDTPSRKGYELHGVDAKRHEEARVRAMDALATLKIKRMP